MAVLTGDAPAATVPTPKAQGYAVPGWKPVVLALFAGWLLLVGSHHEPWVDEAQAWLIARDNGVWTLLADRVRYEGTPGLWHLLLWLLIRLGLPFGALYLVPVACALASAALMLWRAPFPAPLRVLLMVSYYGAYQYAVVARSYALDLLLLMGLASLFARRTERGLFYGLLIGLLANCNAHGFLIAGVLGVEWLVALVRAGRLRADAGGLLLAALLGLAALACAWQPADNGFLQPDKQPPALAVALHFIREAFVDRLVLWRSPSFLEQVQGAAMSLLLLVPPFLLFRRARLLLVMAALFAVLIGFSIVTYTNAWHSGMLFLVFLFGLWIAWPALAQARHLRLPVIAAVSIIGIVQAAEAVQSGLWDIRSPYSGGAAAAAAVHEWRAAHPQARLAVAGFKAFAVQPYFPGNPFANYQGGAPKPAYIVWKRGEAWQPFAPLLEAEKAIARADEGLLLSPYGILPADLIRLKRLAAAHGYRIIGAFPGGLEWKGYVRERDGLLLMERSAAANPALPPHAPLRSSP